MKKQFMSVAVAALFAAPVFAQSNVTISGLVKIGVEVHKLSGVEAGVANYQNEYRLTDQSSRFILAGTEDLGGGLKAFFQIDNRFRLDDAANGEFAGGNSGLGLMGGFGRVTLGRWDLHYTEGSQIESARALADPTIVSHGLLAQVNGTRIAFVSRTNNVVKYDTPSFNGFNATLAYSFNPAGNEGQYAAADKGYNDDGAWNAALRYANGPINAGLSYWDYQVEGNPAAGAHLADQKALRGWFSYTLPMGLKVGLMIDQSKLRNTTGAHPAFGDFQKRTAWMLPISYRTGAHAIYFNYGRAGKVSGDAAAANDTKASQWVLGYDYALSKRTSVGANFTKLSNGDNATYDFKNVRGTPTANGNDAKQLYVGIAHTF